MKFETQGVLGSYIDAILLTILYYSQTSYCLYEDQMGKFDWQHQYIGYVTHIFLGKVLDGGRQIILVTEQNVIASLRMDGNIAWRHVFEGNKFGDINYALKKNDDLIITNKNSTLLRIYDCASSYIKEEISLLALFPFANIFFDNNGYLLSILKENFYIHSISPKFIQVYTNNHSLKYNELKDSHFVTFEKKFHFFTFNLKQRTLIIYLLNGNQNSITINIPNFNYQLISTKSYALIVFENGELVLFNLKNYSQGILDKGGELSLAEFGGKGKFTGKAFEYEDNIILFLHDSNSKILQFYFIEHSQNTNNYVIQKIGGAFLQDVYMYKVLQKHNHALSLYTLSKSGNEADDDKTNQSYDLKFYNIPVVDLKKSILSDKLESQQRFTLRTRSEITKFEIRNDQSKSDIDILVLTEDYALTYISLSKIKWIREESLAYALKVEIIDLPIKDKHTLTTEQRYLDSNLEHPFIPYRIVCRLYYQIVSDLSYQTLKFVNSIYGLFRHLSFLTSEIMTFPRGGIGGGVPIITLIQRLKDSFQAAGNRKGDEILQVTGYATYVNECDHTDGVAEPAPAFRDSFNIRKYLIVLTEVAKLFAIDSKTGQIAYSLQLHNLIPFYNNPQSSREHRKRHGDDNDKETTDGILSNDLTHLKGPQYLLYILRTTSHYPLEPLAIVIGNEPNKAKTDSSRGAIFILFNPITGKIVEPSTLNTTTVDGESSIFHSQIATLDVKQTLQLPFNGPEFEFIKPIVVVDKENTVHVYPKHLTSPVLKYMNKISVYEADPSTGLITGNKIIPGDSDHYQLIPTWSIHLFTSGNQIITSITTKKPNERVDSPGKILEDGGVMYKYLNPNLVVFVTECPMHNCSSSAYFDMTIVDGMNGNIIYSTRHKKCHGPVHVINSENWIFYTYYNLKQRRREVAVIYMFTGKKLIKPSFSSARFPLIETRTFIFPLHCDISAVTTTFTEFGLAQKKIIMALNNGKLYEFSRDLLDQRFSFQKSKDTKPVIFHVPELPFFTQQVINYNRNLAKIVGITVAPTGLESTAIVYAYGLDSYCTRIIPSNHFDVLKDDFDRWIIVAVLFILTLASVMTKMLAVRKELNLAWA